MSLVDIRIELPAYSHSFTVQVQQASSIGDVKQEITKVCPGGPRSDGQKLVYKGRFLKDEETVDDIWKSPDDSRVLHLAVHPSAWSSAPPSTPSSQPSTSGQGRATPAGTRAHPVHSPQSNAYGASFPPSGFFPLQYVIHKHQTAIYILMHNSLPPRAWYLPDSEHWRSVAMDVVQSYGWSWPSILDEEYPSGGIGGVKYDRIILGSQSYLRLATPNASPSLIQVHAFKVISHTFSILCTPPQEALYYPPVATPFPTPTVIDPHTNLNEHLQRLGLPPIRFTHPQNPGANLNRNDPNNIPVAAQAVEIRAIPVRALMIPLMMLVFRTLLLMYFFSPSKRPFFALLLSAWILYEAWGALRMAIGDGRQDRLPVGDGAAGDNQPANGQPGRAGANQRRNGRGEANRGQMQAFLRGLSSLNLRSEDLLLDSPVPAPPPTLSQKVKSFVSLMLLTLHPAVWDHRRAVLRRREGRLRTEATARESVENTESNASEEDRERARSLVRLHERRPVWVREYVQRVLATDWADDV